MLMGERLRTIREAKKLSQGEWGSKGKEARALERFRNLLARAFCFP
jgi:transcriptional regulator with XRE-family HTH domain